MNTVASTSEPRVGSALDSAAQGIVPASSAVDTSSVALEGSSPARGLVSRLGYWVPVFAALVLFAQVAFLGLRPAMREASRLASASDMLHERWTHDRGLYDAYELQLAVRRDPIFLERQSRLRRGARPLAMSESTVDVGVTATDAAHDSSALGERDLTHPTSDAAVSNSPTASTSGY